MKKIGSLLTVLFIFSLTVSVAFGGEIKFSREEIRKLELIKKAKKFGQEVLGLHPTSNFIVFEERLSKYSLLFFSKKTDVAFSYDDPLMSAISSDYDDEKTAVIKYEIATGDYDVFLASVAMSSGTYITRKFLTYSDKTIVRTVLHEDLHDNISLPRHMEESVAAVFEAAAAARFYNESDKDFRVTMGFALFAALDLDMLFHEISDLNQKFKSGELSLAGYLTERDKKIKESYYPSMAEISVMHTYKHYFALWYKLLRAMNFNVPKFIDFLRAFPFKEEKKEWGQQKSFEETMKLEEEASAYVEGVISSMQGKKSDNFDFTENEFEKWQKDYKHKGLLPENLGRFLRK